MCGNDDCNKDKLLDRLDHSEKLIRNQNSGADVHQIGNLRNRIVMLMQTLLEDAIDQVEACGMCMRIEMEIVDFYVKKYTPAGWKPKKRDTDGTV